MQELVMLQELGKDLSLLPMEMDQQLCKIEMICLKIMVNLGAALHSTTNLYSNNKWILK